MTPALGREALEAMKRTDIQKLCKDYGVRANLKTGTLIDLLLDASQPLAQRHNPPQAPQRLPSTRIPSLARVRSKGQTAGSVIDRGSEGQAEPLPQPQQLLQRTRNAKETQYRPGVGRPVTGGSGARAVTKPVNISRTPKRARNNRLIKPSEATIIEEPESNGSVDAPPNPMKSPGRASNQSQPVIHPVPGPSSKALETVIAEAIIPVQQELASHKAQLTDLKDKVSFLIETFETKIRGLTSEIQDLRTRAKSLPSDDATTTAAAHEHSVRMPEPSTPKRVRTPYRPLVLPVTENSELSEFSSDLNVLVPRDSQSADDVEQSGLLLPGFSHSILGKRRRDSMSSGPLGVFGLVHDGVETELDADVGGSPRKRTKLREPDDGNREVSSSAPPQAEPSGPSSPRRRGGPSFTVFSDREGDPPPPIEPFITFYGPTSPPFISAPATRAANNLENQNPFTFAFLPISSTPAPAVFPLAVGAFPRPEPPTSPSPNPDRARSSSRARSPARGEAGGSSGLQRAPSSNEVAMSLGLTAIRTSATEQDSPVPPAKRTLYGTELDSDTRFGDFGVDGVASGFWARGKF